MPSPWHGMPTTCVVPQGEYDAWMDDFRDAVDSESSGDVEYPCGSADDGTATVAYRVWSDTDHEEQLGLTEDAAKLYAANVKERAIGEHGGDHGGDEDHGDDADHDGDEA